MVCAHRRALQLSLFVAKLEQSVHCPFLFLWKTIKPNVNITTGTKHTVSF